jgi:hypothetical protein
MKFKISGFLFILLFCVSIPVSAQLFKPFTSLRVIKTEYFDIIFPVESEPSARLLASYADELYVQVTSTLGIQVPGRIPVTFTPHTDLFNGYYNPASRPHIMLFDTPMDLEWTTFEESLKGLFLHELAHAVSLNTRVPFFRVLHRIFGSWISPAYFNAPAFMIEGVTISFESLSGFGRSNDPRIKQIIRQAIHEDRFPAPFQVSAVYDYPGQAGNWYEYGGLFSTWLIENYGMDKYAELWQAIGRLECFSFNVYRSDFYRIFRWVYNIQFLDAWNAFKDSFALEGLEENPDELLPPRNRFFSHERNFITALASCENNVYVLDRSQGKIRVYDTVTGNIRSFNTASFLSYDLDVSSDGSTLLVSGYHIIGDRYKAVVKEQRASSGFRTGRTITGLFRARYFRDGVIGIRSELHNTCIVYEDFNGNSEILFRGNRDILFSGPQVVDDERIVFIAARNGIRELLLYNYVTGELFRIESTTGDDEDIDPNIWQRYMRGLRVSEGKLFFSYNSDDRMYKLASIDLDVMQAVFSSRDFSGGVFNPVSIGDTVYYRGAFFSGDGLLRFPESADSISGTLAEIKLTKLNSKDYGKAAGLNTNELILPDRALWQGTSKPYISITYMNPFDLWMPFPLLRITGNNNNENETLNLRLDGAGILSIIIDPTDRHFIQTMVYADIAYRMAMVDFFSWQNTVAGFPITLDFSDMVLINNETEPARTYRDTRVSLSAGFSHSPGRWVYGLAASGGYVRIADDDGKASAYEWKESGSLFFYGAAVSLSNRLRRQHELFGSGISLTLRGATIADNFQPRYEGLFRTSAEIQFPVNFVLYGAYDKNGMTLHGESRRYGLSLFDGTASREYNNPEGLSLTWVGGGEFSVGLFSFEIQRNLSHLYFNRFFCTLSLRNVFYDSGGHPGAEGIKVGDFHLAQSLMLRFNLLSSFLLLKNVPFFIEPYIWGAWKISNTITGKGALFNVGISFNASL